MLQMKLCINYNNYSGQNMGCFFVGSATDFKKPKTVLGYFYGV